jgi:hypothetical protein
MVPSLSVMKNVLNTVDLMAVMQRICHPAYLRNGAKRPQQFFEALLLLGKLPFIRQIVVFAAAADLECGAGGKRGHNSLPARTRRAVNEKARRGPGC